MTEIRFAYLSGARDVLEAMVAGRIGLKSEYVGYCEFLDKAENLGGESFGAEGFLFSTDLEAVRARAGDDEVILRIDLSLPVRTRYEYEMLEVTGSGSDVAAPYDFAALNDTGNPFTVQGSAISVLDQTSSEFTPMFALKKVHQPEPGLTAGRIAEIRGNAFAAPSDEEIAAIGAAPKVRLPAERAAIRGHYARKRALAA